MSSEMVGPQSRSPTVDAFLRGMRELGYAFGEHYVTEPRGSAGRPERLPGLAAELVRLQVDVIVAAGFALPALKQATSTIPVVVHLKEGAGRDWDAAMRTRLAAPRKLPGWVGGQLLRPADKQNRRVIVGTWRTRADWEAWHQDPQFAETSRRLDGLESEPAEHWWHEVVLDVRRSAAPPPVKPAATSRASKAKAKGTRKREA
jgi:heme-degrading monooxygenase HmoA